MKTKLLSLALLASTFTACKKDDNKSCPNTMASLAGTYKPTKFELGTGGNFLDVTSSLEACQTDDKLVLNEAGTASYQDAGTVCDPSGNESGTWTVRADGKVDITAGTIDVQGADINSFDCSTLVMTASDGSGTSLRVTLVK